MSDLVEIKSKGILADSLTVAEVFSVSSLLKIKQSDYVNSRGKKYKKYYLDRDAFSLLQLATFDNLLPKELL